MKNVIKSALGLGVLALGLSAAPAFAWSPVGLPYQTWGEVTYTEGDKRVESGFKYDTRVEQGVEVARFGAGNRFAVVPFAALRLTVSDNSAHTWNNRFAQELGVKVKYDVPVRDGHWGQVAVGIKAENTMYFSGDSALGGQVFIQYGFGGDWKK